MRSSQAKFKLCRGGVPRSCEGRPQNFRPGSGVKWGLIASRTKTSRTSSKMGQLYSFAQVCPSQDAEESTSFASSTSFCYCTPLSEFVDIDTALSHVAIRITRNPSFPHSLSPV